MPKVLDPILFTEQTAPGTPDANTVAIYAKSDGLIYGKDDAGVETLLSNTAGGAATQTTSAVAQSSHGLSVANIVRHNGTNYVKAQADSGANAEVVGIVSAVADANNFTLVTAGRVTGLSGLSAGTVYFLSPSTSGLLTATEPSTAGQVSKPVLIADTTTSGYFFNFRGMLISAAAAWGGYATSIGDGTNTSYVVTHSLGSRDVIVQVFDNSTFDQLGSVDVDHTSTTTVTLTFASAPSSSQYRVCIWRVA